MYTDFVQQHIAIPFYVNMTTDHLGLDSLEYSLAPRKFNQYSPVSYQFNEVGFRTHPIDQFRSDAILVLGDSFTLGLGCNVAERFSDIIEQNLKRQVLNFSLNGASNDWIARKLEQLLPFFTPEAIIVHYTFSHRRERPYRDWHDDERTECEPYYSSDANYQNWQDNFTKICQLAKGIKLVHSFIPNWHDQSVDYTGLLPPVVPLDHARDGFHYGPQTHKQLADRITSLLVL